MNAGRLGNLLVSVAAGFAVAGSLSFTSVPDAHAALILSIDDEGDCAANGDNCDVYIVDDGDGRIDYTGVIDNWAVTMTTGLSKPAIGDGDPMMQFNSVDLSSSQNGGTVYLSLTDTDFTSPETLTNWITSIEGLTTGTFSFEVYVNGDNLIFSTDGTNVADLQYIDSFFDETYMDQTWLDPNEPFSLTLLATVTHGGGFQGTVYSATVSGEPQSISEPNTLSLFGFGIGLLGFGVLFRRQVRARSKSKDTLARMLE